MNIENLISVCIILGICIVIVLILYFRNTPNKYKNKVDQEIENELKKKH